MKRPNDPFDWRSWAWSVIRGEGEEMSATAGLVLLALAEHANADGLARPSARRLAADYLGRSDRAVRRALHQLAERGVIVAAGSHNKTVIWKLGADHGSAPGLDVSADPGSALTTGECGASAARVRLRCGASANPWSGREGEGEGEELPLSQPPVADAHADAREAPNERELNVIDITSKLAAAISMTGVPVDMTDFQEIRRR